MAGAKTEALILRSVDFGESDRILHLLVPGAGRLTAIAKGARRSVRRFPGTLDLFNHLRVSLWHGKRGVMARLEQATLIESFTQLRVDSARFALGCYQLELLDRLAPEGAGRADAQKLFRFALAALRAVSSSPPDVRLRVLLELRALDALGLCPQFSHCVRCAAPPAGAQVGFDVADGGVVCNACAARRDGLLRVQLGTVRALAQGLRFDLEQLDRLLLSDHTLREAQGLLARFQRFHVGVDLKSQRFLDEILAPPAARSA